MWLSEKKEIICIAVNELFYIIYQLANIGLFKKITFHLISLTTIPFKIAWSKLLFYSKMYLFCYDKKKCK